MSCVVLFVNTPSHIGGAEICLLSLAKGLDRGRYQPHVVTGSDGTFFKRVRDANIPATTIEFHWFSRRYPWRYYLATLNLIRYIRKNRVVLVDTHCTRSLPYVGAACRIAGVPYISHIHDSIRPWFSDENLKVLKGASFVVANSKSISEACLENGLNRAKVVTIYNPIDLLRFSGQPDSDREKWKRDQGLPLRTLVVSIVGEIEAIKGHMEFVEAAERISTRYDNVHFLIVGDSHSDENLLFKDALVRRVNAAKYPSRFHFLGFREDVDEVLKHTDILVVPSWTEAFGRVAAEGMASGCAVVASDVGGLTEIITHKIDGLLVEARNSMELCTTIEKLIEDPEMRHQLAEKGRQSAQRFTLEKSIEKTQSLFDRVQQFC